MLRRLVEGDTWVLRLGREARRGASFPDSITVGRGVCRVECIRDRYRIIRLLEEGMDQNGGVSEPW